ncbi:MAG: hypothetical protein JSS66_06575 [Armatimonadetes bacterium]|nr:hypothetical protein [Armatimonadota bacterium]
MAKYALFHDARRVICASPLPGMGQYLQCFQDKDQLSKFLEPQMPKVVRNDVSGMHGVNYHSFEAYWQTAFSQLNIQCQQAFALAAARVVCQMYYQKLDAPESYGDSFVFENVSANGRSHYDPTVVRPKDDEFLLCVGGSVPTDFIESFPDRFVTTDPRSAVSFLGLVNKASLVGGVALFVKRQGIIQVHVGAAVCGQLRVRKIDSEHITSDLDNWLRIDQALS